MPIISYSGKINHETVPILFIIRKDQPCDCAYNFNLFFISQQGVHTQHMKGFDILSCVKKLDCITGIAASE